MNKKAEIGITLGLIVALLLLGLSTVVVNYKLENKMVTEVIPPSQMEISNCIGNNDTKTVYRLDSKNNGCEIDKIVILENSTIIAKSCDFFIDNGFRFDKNCN